MRLACISIFLLLITTFCANNSPESVNGEIIETHENLKVVKVWGTHEERGFAYGYLLCDAILDNQSNYINVLFDDLYLSAKEMIQNESHFVIPPKFIKEAQSIVKGMKAKKPSLSNFDEWDILLGNSFLDIMGFQYELANGKYGCSSLISWGDATKGTDLDGKAVISRHVDWMADETLTKNNVVVVHVPSEEDEQPWAMVGFAGQMGVLSGMNEQGVGAFQHVVFSSTSRGELDSKYEPIWLTLRNGIEQKDFNQDGENDVNDIKAAIESNEQGYADSYIVSAIANTEIDDKVALIAEIDPKSPYYSFRGNEYQDSIPGDNLYTANNEFKHGNKNKICSRYSATTDAIGSGENVSSIDNWNILKTHSNSEELGFDNVQFMQYVPYKQLLKISIYENELGAYQNEAYTIELDELFSKKR